jgi:sugar fermentation stimulation protein A
MHFFKYFEKAIFAARPNRFIVECILSNRSIRAYLPNPGRLWELFFPGTVLYLVRNAAPGSTDHTVVAVERDGIPIMLHTHVNNLVARYAIEARMIPGLEGATVLRQEVTIGKSRFDFLLQQDEKDVVVEVKSCTLVGNRIAMFPDAVTIRGRRHLQELAELSKEGKKAVVLFMVHWAKADFFMPEWHTDLELARTMLSVKDHVQIKALTVEWRTDLTPGCIREIVIPWNLIEQEAHDRGSYIFIVRLRQDRRVSIAGLGEMKFRKGYYCYIGSAKEDLGRRLERHQRLRKKLSCQIDQLRAAADFHAAIPIRASEDLECEIAAAMAKISDWSLPGFGSTDCNCQTHLFGMHEDPVHTRSFSELLIYFRMDRLEKYLSAGSGERNVILE